MEASLQNTLENGANRGSEGGTPGTRVRPGGSRAEIGVLKPVIRASFSLHSRFIKAMKANIPGGGVREMNRGASTAGGDDSRMKRG